MLRIWRVDIAEKGSGAPSWESKDVAARTIEAAIRKALPKRRRAIPLEVLQVKLIAQSES